MKYLIGIIFSLVLYTAKSQVTYPHLFEDSVGHKFIIMTMEQAQKLDNATEFSPILFKQTRDYAKLIDSLCIQTIELKNLEVIALQTEKQKIADTLLVVLTQLDTVNQQNYLFKQEFNQTVIDYNTLLEKRDEAIKKEKRKTAYAIRVGILTLAALIFSLL